MTDLAYYNEHDPEAAAVLRELIKQGLIAPGVVDERSILDVRPSDLVGYTQCHFFAGIGIWSLALRRAGVPDSCRVWTGSCPCQPFSDAGAGAGFADKRHLWPALFWLIAQCEPDIFYGEQVASSDGLAWLDLVLSDLEGAGYAAGASDQCAAGWGAPHIRQRLFIVGHTVGARLERHSWHEPRSSAFRSRDVGAGGPAATTGLSVGLAHSDRLRLESLPIAQFQADAEHDVEPFGGAGRLADLHCFIGDEGRGSESGSDHRTQQEVGARPGSDHVAGRLADADLPDAQQLAWQGPGSDEAQVAGPHGGSDLGHPLYRPGLPGPTNGFWRDADWLFCRDGKWRPVEPGTFPLADGYPARVGLLRCFGNAINSRVAQGFIEATREAINES